MNLRVVLLIALAVYLRAANVFAADVSVQESQVDSLGQSAGPGATPALPRAIRKITRFGSMFPRCPTSECRLRCFWSQRALHME